MNPSRLNNCLLPELCWFTAMTSSFVSNESVKGSSFVKSPPMMSGDRAMLQSVIIVCCSLRVKLLFHLPIPRTPSGSMSASGKCPGPMNRDHLLQRSNCSNNNCHLSQKSSLMRHIFACCETCGASATGVSPGEVLNTIGRPVASIALRIASTSGRLRGYGLLKSSTFTKSTPQLAINSNTES